MSDEQLVVAVEDESSALTVADYERLALLVRTYGNTEQSLPLLSPERTANALERLRLGSPNRSWHPDVIRVLEPFASAFLSASAENGIGEALAALEEHIAQSSESARRTADAVGARAECVETLSVLQQLLDRLAGLSPAEPSEKSGSVA